VTSDRDDGLRGHAANLIHHAAPVDPVAVVEADQRQLHQSRAFAEQGQQVEDFQHAFAVLPHDKVRLLPRRKPGRRASGEVEIGDQHFIARLQIECAGEQVVSLRTARAEGHLIGLQADHGRGDLAAFVDTCKVMLAPRIPIVLCCQ